jgi:hypothetical protein
MESLQERDERRLAKAKKRAKARLSDVNIDELSLVDSPAVPTAQFVLAKRDYPPAAAPPPAEMSLDDAVLALAFERTAAKVEEAAIQSTLFNLRVNMLQLDRRLDAMAAAIS